MNFNDIKRFDLKRHIDHAHCGMSSDPKGEWVTYSDAKRYVLASLYGDNVGPNRPMITEELVLAVEMAADDMRTLANDVEKQFRDAHNCHLSTAMALLLERKRQSADLLAGWAARARVALDLPK